MRVGQWILLASTILLAAATIFFIATREPVDRSKIVRIEGPATSGYCVTSRSMNSLYVFVAHGGLVPTEFIVFLPDRVPCNQKLIDRMVGRSVAIYLYDEWVIGLELEGAPLFSMERQIMSWETRYSVIGFFGTCAMACGYVFYRSRRRSRSVKSFS